ELAAGAAKKLGMSRRKFLATTGGMAAAFLAMNEVYGRFFNVSRSAMFDTEAFASDGPPPSLFVFDDQLHMIRQSVVTTNRALRALAQGYTAQSKEFPQNPFNPGGLLDEPAGRWGNWNPVPIKDRLTQEINLFGNFTNPLYLHGMWT